MPKIAELADRVITLVTEESDIPKEAILSKSRTAEVVDARHLAIKLLHSKDIYPSRIAAKTEKSRPSPHSSPQPTAARSARQNLRPSISS